MLLRIYSKNREGKQIVLYIKKTINYTKKNRTKDETFVAPLKLQNVS